MAAMIAKKKKKKKSKKILAFTYREYKLWYCDF